MRVAIAIAALGGSFLGCLILVRAARPRAVALAAPLALALLVCFETAILRALSAVHAVTALPMALANFALLGAGALVAWRVPSARLRPPVRLAGAPWAVLAPLCVLFALAAASALAYRPNNWDSMTYHLARVAHWIQHRSVEDYPTGISRQNVLTPGAEYLLLVLQSIAGTDRLANLVQLASWVMLVAAAVPLARSFGASRGAARVGALVVGAAPMAVLQASSTQNDLVAAATTAALAAAAVPFLHRRRRWRQGDLALVLVAGAGAVMVKPTAVLVAVPLLAFAGVGLGRTVLAGGRRALRELAPAAALVLVLAAPLAATARAGSEATHAFVYHDGSAAELADRALNALRGVLRNLPFERAGNLLAPARTVGCEHPGRLCLSLNRLPHEDAAGNPALAVLAIAAAVCAALRWSSTPARARVGAAALVGGWVLFHAVLRDNVWIPRLQLPAAVLAVLALGALPRGRASRVRMIAFAALGALAFAHGARAAVLNVRRPVRHWQELRQGGAPATYYRAGPAGLEAAHAQVLEGLARSGCGRLGLFLDGDSYDYPLTWRAMQRGVEVRHVRGPDAWPCAVFSDLGAPPARPDGAGWKASSAAGFFEATPAPR